MSNAEEAAAAVDPLEEVLEQSSQQTLKLSHLDEGLRTLHKAVDDLSETMQAGFVELRQVAAQKPTAPAPAFDSAALGLPSNLGARLDELEVAVAAQGKKQGLLLGLVAVQLVVCLVLALVAFGVIKGGAQPEPPPPVVAPPVVQPPPAPAVVKPAEPEATKLSKKKKPPR